MKRAGNLFSSPGLMEELYISEIYRYEDQIALQVSPSHICGGSFSEKPVGRSSRHRSDPNVCSKPDAKP